MSGFAASQFDLFGAGLVVGAGFCSTPACMPASHSAALGGVGKMRTYHERHKQARKFCVEFVSESRGGARRSGSHCNAAKSRKTIERDCQKQRQEFKQHVDQAVIGWDLLVSDNRVRRMRFWISRARSSRSGSVRGPVRHRRLSSTAATPHPRPSSSGAQSASAASAWIVWRIRRSVVWSR